MKASVLRGTESSASGCDLRLSSLGRPFGTASRAQHGDRACPVWSRLSRSHSDAACDGVQDVGQLTAGCRGGNYSVRRRFQPQP